MEDHGESGVEADMVDVSGVDLCGLARLRRASGSDSPLGRALTRLVQGAQRPDEALARFQASI